MFIVFVKIVVKWLHVVEATGWVTDWENLSRQQRKPHGRSFFFLEFNLLRFAEVKNSQSKSTQNRAISPEFGEWRQQNRCIITQIRISLTLPRVHFLSGPGMAICFCWSRHCTNVGKILLRIHSNDADEATVTKWNTKNDRQIVEHTFDKVGNGSKKTKTMEKRRRRGRRRDEKPDATPDAFSSWQWRPKRQTPDFLALPNSSVSASPLRCPAADARQSICSHSRTKRVERRPPPPANIVDLLSISARVRRRLDQSGKNPRKKTDANRHDAGTGGTMHAALRHGRPLQRPRRPKNLHRSR